MSRLIDHKVTDIFVAVLILLSVIFLLLEFSEYFDDVWTTWLRLIGEMLTAIFIIELTIRFYVTGQKRLFFRKYWIDIIAVFPFARSLRIFRVLRLLRIFRAGILLSRSLESFRHVFIEGRSETLVILAIIFILVATCGIGIHLIEPSHEDFDSIDESIWWSLLSLIAGEPIGGSPNSTFGKVMMITIMLGGLTVFAMFTGVVSAVMVKRLRSEMEIKSMEIEDITDHIIICGWNRLAPLLFQEFHNDPKMSGRPIVVIAEFGEMDVLELAGSHRQQVFPLNGDPTRFEVLEQAGAERAKFSIILADKLIIRSDQDRDARTILSALTLEKMNPEIYTMAELLSSEGVNHLKIAGVEEVMISDEIASNMIASSIRNRGMMAMVEELFSARFGNQFYKVPIQKSMIGITFKEVFNRIKQVYNALTISIERALEHDTKDNCAGNLMKNNNLNKTRMIINPDFEMVLEKGDILVVIAGKQPILDPEE